ncbi:hypothetical protein M9Y10_017773 [Tritrichomonas musculus]|uniref:Uncharacterized protein n=1 Tax=Tritrichomonas musculus TaxID=1915356 RepID=A0ABR2HUG6_9EUKA
MDRNLTLKSMRFEIGYVRWGYPPPERVTALSSCLFFKWLMIPDNSLPLKLHSAI